jgi:prostaglandin-H2 D-isomerase / glutathione transferase
MKLVYFNARGLAETSRVLFAIKGEQYEDFRYPLEIIDWATHNMVRNKLPYLEVEGEIIPQSKAIERYLAKRFNMMGDNDIEYARIDGITEYVKDFKTAYQTVRKLPANQKENGLKEWFADTLKEKLELLENLLCREHQTFAVGNRLSLADVSLYSFITEFFDDKESAWNSTVECPKLRSIVNNVRSNENLTTWVNNRPNTAF